ncbi:MAG TPA: hypothetical protein VN684_08315 [Terriglobales bacterium]|nr:hypothetical protein [Terriglobales bacterium]
MRVYFFILLAAILFVVPVHGQTNSSPSSKTSAAKASLGRNLILNGDAEQATDTMWAPFWQPGGTLEEAGYGQKPGEWRKGVQGAPHGGCCYFRLEWQDKQTSKAAFQTIDLSALSGDIDQGKVWGYLSGYLGGLLDGGTTVRLEVSWQDAAGKELDKLSVSAVMPMDLRRPFAGAASVVQRQQSGPIPRGARKAVVRFSGEPMKDSQFGYLALADNLSLTLSEIAAQ